MYKFVDIKGIAKGKIIRQLDKLSEQGISVNMSKQALDKIADSILSIYLNGSNQSLNELDNIIEKRVGVNLLELV